MPFGLWNAPATFQSLMATKFKAEFYGFTITYLDDIVIYSNDIESYNKHLEIVLEKLKAAGISLNKSRCKFFNVK